ncbi:unnamed protein product [Ilex paraguariensis]|uniref:Tubby C-terminal domain-containing protein n=1 Tax=Ilex paraguariensis TaxID=185542 RepID=A0ABC8U3R5_9AQUA
MPFKRIIDEVRGIRENIEDKSRRQDETKCVLGRGRSHTAPERSPSPRALFQQRRWANLPPELLLDIIRRIEAMRETTKEVVKTPEQCGLLTFPMSLKQEVSSRVPVGNYKVDTISYELNVLRTRGRRRMKYTMLLIPVSAIQKGDPLILKKKAPRWHEQLQCWCLNFKGRVTVASVKNFQLVAAVDSFQNVPAAERDKVILQFGKLEKTFIRWTIATPSPPFKPFQSV